jgi:hypothetical protein
MSELQINGLRSRARHHYSGAEKANEKGDKTKILDNPNHERTLRCLLPGNK